MKLKSFLEKSPSWLASLLDNPKGSDVDLIKLREGLKLTWYKDTLGKWTGGYGHLRQVGDPEKFDQKQADQWLEADLTKARKSALEECEQLPFYTKELLDVMVSVNYQLGTEWEFKFKNTFALMKQGRFNDAAWAVESSLWHKQTPVRVRDFQRALWRCEALYEVYKANS